MTSLLSARGLGKEYVLRSETSLLLALRGKRPRRLWALRDLDLDLTAGEVLAVVGRNGAGKSTLLKLASGVTTPTVGSLRRPARIAPLIEVGAGFHPELSGRENIEVNARLLGIGPQVLRRRFDDIVAFADLAHAIDQPVKEYSSGMYMRLGFAVAVHTDPELLVVDEVLAVGDLPFQVRCLERIRSMREAGVGVLFVSHNLSSVAEIADRALFLEKGVLRAEGDPREVIGAYQASLDAGDQHADEGVATDDRLEIALLDGRFAEQVFRPGDPVELPLRLTATAPTAGLLVGFQARRPDGFLVGGWHQPIEAPLPPLALGESTEVRLRFDLNLVPGSYRVDVGVASADFSTVYAHRPGLVTATVLGPHGAGIADLGASLTVQPIPPSTPLPLGTYGPAAGWATDAGS